MQICTSPHTDNHASTPPLTFLQARCPSCRPTTSVKALKVNRLAGAEKTKPNTKKQEIQTTLHPFNGLFSRTTWVSRHPKGKPFWILMKQRQCGSSGSWTICKSFTLCFRQITMPAPSNANKATTLKAKAKAKYSKAKDTTTFSQHYRCQTINVFRSNVK